MASLKKFMKRLFLMPGYGEIRELLRELDKRHLIYVAQIPENHSFWPIDTPLNFTLNIRGQSGKHPRSCR
ncbi:hypothetical protein DB42_BN00160 [Neochlamydia sp. EPS4]|nr:hypothetical protein DB42_BN00160 [Neochlamydia sp. EPS4]